MANLGAGDEDRELWRRWRALGEIAPAPDAMTLAAYAEQRLGESEAASVEAIVAEMLVTTLSERQGRAIDYDEAASMEKKKQEGYF